MKDCNKLENLWIGSNFQNDITDDGLANLKEMNLLAGLDILGTRATDAGLGHIKGLKNLKSLAIGSQQIKTGITDAGTAHLAGLSQLEDLNMVNVPLTDAGLEHLKKLTNLKRLVLTKTEATEAGVKSLQTVLPKCRIEFVANPK